MPKVVPIKPAEPDAAAGLDAELDLLIGRALHEPLNVELAVKVAVAIRDDIEAREETIKAKEAKLAKVTNRLLAFLDATRQKSARTAAGTITAVARETAALFDPDVFMDFVRKNDAYVLMDRRANKTACIDFRESHGTLPPGVKINVYHHLSVRKATNG
jgi:hypothetical protein